MLEGRLASRGQPTTLAGTPQQLWLLLLASTCWGPSPSLAAHWVHGAHGLTLQKGSSQTHSGV